MSSMTVVSMFGKEFMHVAHVLSRPLFELAPVVVLSWPRLPADDHPHFSSRAP